MMTARMLSALFLALVLSAAPGRALAQGSDTSHGPTGQAASVEGEGMPDGALGRIRRGLAQPPAVDLERELLRFYSTTVAEQPPAVENPFNGVDLQYGPRRGGAAFTHSEFLAMVTPQELYSQAGFGAAELLQAALVNWLSQSLIQRAVSDLRQARSEAEIREIRERIDRELEEINQRTRSRQESAPE